MKSRHACRIRVTALVAFIFLGSAVARVVVLAQEPDKVKSELLRQIDAAMQKARQESVGRCLGRFQRDRTLPLQFSGYRRAGSLRRVGYVRQRGCDLWTEQSAGVFYRVSRRPSIDMPWQEH